MAPIISITATNAGGSAAWSTQVPMSFFSITPGQEFPATSWVYRTLAANAPLDPSSASVVTALHQGLLAAAGAIYWFADYPIYRVDPNTPTVPVLVGTLNPDGTIWREPNQIDLQPLFLNVPMPDPNTFVTMLGSDHEAVIYKPSTHELWEGWLWYKTGRTVVNSAGQTVPEWGLEWGGYEADMRTNPGWWPTMPLGDKPGAVAAGIPIPAFAITIGDIKQQAVNHAVGLVIPSAINYPSWWNPAQRTDGQVPNAPVLEGMIFRFPANIDFNLFPATAWDGVSPKSVWRLFAEATRDHGMVIYDQAANAVAVGEAGATPQYATDPFLTDPIVSGSTFGQDSLAHAIPDYPWQHLQLLAQLP